MTTQQDFVTAADASDADLVRAFRAGDPDAFGEIYRRYFPALVAWAAPRTSSRAAAEDLAQDTLVRAVRYIGSYNESREFWPWLRTVATHLLGVSLAQPAETPLSRLPETAVPGPHEALVAHHRASVMHDALSTLPPRMRSALWMRYGEDRSAAEVAERFGLTTNALDQLMWRARRRLRDEVRRVDAALAGFALPAAFLRFLRRKARPSATSASKWSLPATLAPMLTLTVVGGVVAPVLSLPGHAAERVHAAVAPRMKQVHAVDFDRRLTARLSATAHRFVHAQETRPQSLASRQLSVAKGPAVAGVHVAQNPAHKGRVEQDRIEVVTPAGTVSTGGYVLNKDNTRLVCRVGVVQCSMV